MKRSKTKSEVMNTMIIFTASFIRKMRPRPPLQIAVFNRIVLVFSDTIDELTMLDQRFFEHFLEYFVLKVWDKSKGKNERNAIRLILCRGVVSDGGLTVPCSVRLGFDGAVDFCFCARIPRISLIPTRSAIDVVRRQTWRFRIFRYCFWCLSLWIFLGLEKIHV